MPISKFQQYVEVAQRFAARTLLFQTALARELDLTVTELECFRLVKHEEPLTASKLVNGTGLTAPSLSVIVDKLVGRGFLSREQDRTDRRRWLLRTEPEAVAQVDAVYDAHAKRIEKLLAEYSDEEFEVALRFMERLADEPRPPATELSINRLDKL